MCAFTCFKAHMDEYMYVCGFVCDSVSPPNFSFTYLSQWWQCSSLHWASERGHHEIVQLLIDEGADVNGQEEVRVVYI